MSKYCCFFCPAKDFSMKSLQDKCSNCGRTYGFALDHAPRTVRDYKIVRALGRGFYGATYVAERGVVGRKFVVKISPVQFYSFFGKPSFEEESRLHGQLAENAAHIVAISDAFEEVVEFDNGTQLSCNVTILDFVDGPLLKEFLNRSEPPSAATICQIAIDLISLRAELENSRLNHNDLHAENLIIQQLPIQKRRPDAIDGLVRVMAIDLGSLAGESKSDDIRKGDLTFIAEHVGGLLGRLLGQQDRAGDVDFRIGLSLQGLVNSFQASAENSRLPNPADLIEQVREAYFRASRPWYPWRSPLVLRSFADHYNAQTLESWNVPQLLVDPDGRWLKEVSRPGPEIITGMRGCGKTMLLRALDLHARASQRASETKTQLFDRIRGDGFVGLFVSAQRLLDLREQTLLKIEYRLTRLYIAYALQAVRALMHIRDVDAAAVAGDAHTRLGSATADYLEGADHLRSVLSLEDLENQLLRAIVLSASNHERYVVKRAPAEVFPHIAEQFRNCADVFQQSTVLFLLDDVSTRYLDLDRIEALLSALLFQSPICAFKFTSEWQTIELGLRSPGRNHPIRVGRDLAIFDLGADVLEKINSPGSAGKQFVSSILMQRSAVLSSHPTERRPDIILGDVSLEQVAREIATLNETSGQKKRVYRGISCLANVCVGDIGDVIKIYEDIIRRAEQPTFPIPPDVQSQCFQDMSARRLYDLNRRASAFKNHALAFAEASHDLLVRSATLTTNRNQPSRLRQYSSIYIRIVSDDEATQKQQIDLLREIIDAGVFVFSGGSPRTKTKDSNPIQQFVLTYRKIYGLAAYIGLADRDRFELSGSDLSEWLNNPSMAKEILLRNQINEEVVSGSDETPHRPREEVVPNPQTEKAGSNDSQPKQADLFGLPGVSEKPAKSGALLAERLRVRVDEIGHSELSKCGISSVISGLGFEERTLASNEFLASKLTGLEVHLIRYPAAGHAHSILRIWEAAKAKVADYPYLSALANTPTLRGLALVDVSGLTKPIIFSSIRQQLMREGRVLVCHASAKYHYPLEEDIQALFAAQKSDNPIVFLEHLDELLRGEKGPYRDIRLLNDDGDPSRGRALLAFASSKHERLFSLLDRREFDQIDVIAPTGSAPRARVAQIAADFVRQNYPNVKVTQIDTNDLFGLVRFLDEEYLNAYGAAGANVEMGLTGSKIQAVSAAILSSVRKVSQCWYLSPAEFDEKRFSTGVGPIRVFEIRMKE